MDEDQRAELRCALGDRIDRLWDLLGLPAFRKPDFGVCADGTLVRWRRAVRRRRPLEVGPPTR